MLLMDTHVWFWSLTEPEKIAKAAFRLIQRTKPDQRAVASEVPSKNERATKVKRY
jgi:PIN domain nuclease of toxin-antitoxin system